MTDEYMRVFRAFTDKTAVRRGAVRVRFTGRFENQPADTVASHEDSM